LIFKKQAPEIWIF